MAYIMFTVIAFISVIDNKAVHLDTATADLKVSGQNVHREARALEDDADGDGGKAFLWQAITAATNLHKSSETEVLQQSSMKAMSKEPDKIASHRSRLMRREVKKGQSPNPFRLMRREVWDTLLTPPSSAVKELVQSPLYSNCMGLLGAKYSVAALCDWENPPDHSTALPIAGRNWTIREIPVDEMSCQGACKAPPWICGKHVIRVWFSGMPDGNITMVNYDQIKLLDSQGREQDNSLKDYHPHSGAPGDRWLSHLSISQTDSVSLLTAAAFAPPDLQDWLILGLGNGGRGKLIHEFTPWHVDFVELDSKVVDLATRYFNFPELPRDGLFGKRCSSDGRICVAIGDACAHSAKLASRGQRYGLVYMDVDPDAVAEDCLKPLLVMSEVVVLNMWNHSNLESSAALFQKLFHKVRYLALPPGDNREYFIMGLGSKALDEEAALAHAQGIDVQMDWMPLSLASHMQTGGVVNATHTLSAREEPKKPENTVYLNKLTPLNAQEQGYSGKQVQYKDQDTMTRDWGKEYGGPEGHSGTTRCNLVFATALLAILYLGH